MQTGNGSSSYEQIYSLSTNNTKSSFPKQAIFYRIIGPLSMVRKNGIIALQNNMPK